MRGLMSLQLAPQLEALPAHTALEHLISHSDIFIIVFRRESDGVV